MSLLLLIILLGIALAGTIWGVGRKDRYYQFPTLFCATWLLYFGPQAIGAVANKDKYPASLHADHGLELALFLCILCSLAGLAGYAYAERTKRELFHFRSYSHDGLFIGGIVLCFIGLWGAYELAQLSGGLIAQFTGGGHYALEWRGAPVMYTFFVRLLGPGLLLVFLATLRRPSILRWSMFCLCLMYPLAVVVFLGRRSMAALLAITILLSVFFAKRWAPPRGLFAAFLVLAGIGTILAPAYRTRAQYGLDTQELREIDAPGIVSDVFSGEHYGEFDMIVYGCAAVNRGLAFDYGLNIYNASVVVLVPRQLVGEKFKNSLLIRSKNDPGALMERYYNWSIPYGTNPTGPFDAFARFWFFGCLLYFGIGYIYRCLWTAAYFRNNIGAQLWYTQTAIIVPGIVFGGISLIVPTLLQVLMSFGLVLYLARRGGNPLQIPHSDAASVPYDPCSCGGPGSGI